MESINRVSPDGPFSPRCVCAVPADQQSKPARIAPPIIVVRLIASPSCSEPCSPSCADFRAGAHIDLHLDCCLIVEATPEAGVPANLQHPLIVGKNVSHDTDDPFAGRDIE